MTWAQMKEMTASGLVDMQPHSKTHANLTLRQPGESDARYRERVRREVDAPVRRDPRRSSARASFALRVSRTATSTTCVVELLREGRQARRDGHAGRQRVLRAPVHAAADMIFGGDDLDAFRAKLVTFVRTASRMTSTLMRGLSWWSRSALARARRDARSAAGRPPAPPPVAAPSRRRRRRRTVVGAVDRRTAGSPTARAKRATSPRPPITRRCSMLLAPDEPAYGASSAGDARGDRRGRARAARRPATRRWRAGDLDARATAYAARAGARSRQRRRREGAARDRPAPR